MSSDTFTWFPDEPLEQLRRRLDKWRQTRRCPHDNSRDCPTCNRAHKGLIEQVEEIVRVRDAARAEKTYAGNEKWGSL